jgi:hypothetical protein
MKTIFTELNKTRKENPKAFYGDLVFLVSAFALFYTVVTIFN